MASDFSNYGFGRDGVNLVKNPLEMGDGEASQLQNAELRLDQASVGESALGKRGGFVALNGSALASTVLGMIGLNLKTTYTRTLYAGLGTAAANTFRTTTNGSTFANSSAALVGAAPTKFADADSKRDARRIASFRNFIVYPYNTYTKGTDNPIIAIYNGTDALQLTSIPIGPSATAGTPAYAIVDMLTANGWIYMAIHDPGGSGANLAGRVMRLNLETGVLQQVATSFGNTSANFEIAGGYPCCLAWYQDQIWAGLNTNTTTDNIGKVVRCYPDIATDWTSDTAVLPALPCSLAVYKGDLYAGTRNSAANSASVYKRSATAGTWAASFTGASGATAAGSGYCTSLIVYGTNLYAAEWFGGATDVLHIKAFDGTTWTTDRDVDATDGVDATNPQMPGNSCLLGDDLLWSIRTVNESDSATDGYILRKSGGSWSKVDAAINSNGMLAVLVQRS